jgi:hypothetical protein
MTRHVRTVGSLVALGIAALAAAPAFAGETAKPAPPEISVDHPYIFEHTLWMPHVDVVPPSGVARAKACHGRVHLTARAKGKVVGSKAVALSGGTCGFTTTLAVGSARRVRLTVWFPGNRQMAGAKRTFTVKPGRPKFDPNVG